jgi:phosphomannomutase
MRTGVRAAIDNHLDREEQRMSRQYFGTDGIRGTVGQPPITPDFMLRLGHAVGHVLRRTTTRGPRC